MGAFAPMFFKRRPFDDTAPSMPDIGASVPGRELRNSKTQGRHIRLHRGPNNGQEKVACGRK